MSSAIGPISGMPGLWIRFHSFGSTWSISCRVRHRGLDVFLFPQRRVPLQDVVAEDGSYPLSSRLNQSQAKREVNAQIKSKPIWRNYSRTVAARYKLHRVRSTAVNAGFVVKRQRRISFRPVTILTTPLASRTPVTVRLPLNVSSVFDRSSSLPPHRQAALRQKQYQSDYP